MLPAIRPSSRGGERGGTKDSSADAFERSQSSTLAMSRSFSRKQLGQALGNGQLAQVSKASKHEHTPVPPTTHALSSTFTTNQHSKQRPSSWLAPVAENGERHQQPWPEQGLGQAGGAQAPAVAVAAAVQLMPTRTWS